MRKFSVVIPLIPAHDRELKRIFRGLALESGLISEVIIARSETQNLSVGFVRIKYWIYAKLSHLNVPIVLSVVSAQAYDGTNRNRGWLISKSDVVAFMDADDLYVENRLQILSQVFTDPQVNSVVHSYSDEDLFSMKIQSRRDDFWRIRVKQEDRIQLDNELVDLAGNPIKVHHALITVRNSVKEKVMFTDIFPGADKIFCLELANRGLLHYTPLELSNWNRKRSLRYLMRLLKSKLRRVL